MDRKCLGRTEAGDPCNSQPVRPSGWCWFHDPALVAEREVARRRGGVNRSNRARVRKQLGEGALSMAETAGLVSMALRGVLSGRLTPGAGTAVASLARALTVVHEITEVEARLAALEAAALTDRRRA